MSTGNGDRCVIVAHDLSEKLGPGQHWNAFFHSTGIFRIIRMDSSCVNHKLNIVCNIRSTLSVENACALLGQGIGKRALLGIRTGNLKILAKKDFSQATHADSTNTDKVNVKRFMEVYLIHNNLLIKSNDLLK